MASKNYDLAPDGKPGCGYATYQSEELDHGPADPIYRVDAGSPRRVV